MRDLEGATLRLKHADNNAILLIATHDPEMIREVVEYLYKQRNEFYEKLERFETLQASIMEFLKIE